MSVPICISLISKDDSSSLNKDESEQMQINDEGDTLPVTKSDENVVTLTNLAKEPLVRIYLTLLEVIPSRLPSLITLLNSSCPPLISSFVDNSQTVKYQFISEPLG